MYSSDAWRDLSSSVKLELDGTQGYVQCVFTVSTSTLSCSRFGGNVAACDRPSLCPTRTITNTSTPYNSLQAVHPE